MEMTDAKVVEKKIYEEGKKHDDYASKATGNAGLTLGIIGTALGAGAWLFGGNRSVFGSLGGNMPENVNINAYGYGANANANQPTALQVMEKECADEVKLLTDMFGLKLDTANKFYAMRETDIAEKFSMYKGANDAINAENRRAMQAEFGLYKSQIDADFGLYKNQRDQYDALQAKYSDLDKKVAVMEALTPYKEKLMMAYVNEKTCNCLRGQLVLPSTPVISGYGSYCCTGTAPSTPTTGA
ncbi:hypothetical protein [Segatella copri]|uniref:hypothetical protein n=1 Tax=Segatella copri TaxID=165179 RepID=UPI00185F6C72|nr:hypothetical protein [Segatella copri]MBM0154227.1 hypothetical protein [Segatella copri]MBM0155416.1 hypothetical protein [Segatella copri]QNT65646.1 hypothetical protein FO447_03360 [Segatella copri]